MNRKILRAAQRNERKKGKFIIGLCASAKNVIAFNNKEQRSFFRGVYPEPQTLTLIPPFDEGAFIANYDDYNGYLTWEIEKIRKDQVDLYLQMGYRRDDPIFIGSAKLSFPLTIHGYEHDIELHGLETPILTEMRKANYSTKELEAEMDAALVTIQPIFHLFIRTIAWFNFLLDNPDYKAAKKISATEAEVNGISVTSEQPKIRKIASKRRQRICSLWSVSGHFRHYKNGKIIYIEPYLKGKNRNLKS